MADQQLNANQFPQVYAALGITISQLGIVMLDTDPIEVTEKVDQGKADLFTSSNPERFWIDGAVVEREAHVTLLFGLLASGTAYKSMIDAVLADWTPPTLEIESVGSFPSTFGDEDYACIVAHIKVSDQLLEGHARLQLLPHIDTFPDYKPHLTLAYVQKSAEAKWLKALGTSLNGTKLEVNALNYGGNR